MKSILSESELNAELGRNLREIALRLQAIRRLFPPREQTDWINSACDCAKVLESGMCEPCTE